MIVFFVFLATFLSIISIILVLSGIKIPASMETAAVLNLLGVTITGISFMIACYFVLKAIDAYSHLKKIAQHLEEIHDNKEKLKKDVDTLSKTRDEAFSTIGTAAESIFTNINDTLYAATKSKVFSDKVKLEIIRLTEISMHSIGRLSFIKHLPDSDRINYLQKLGQYGDEDDLENLTKLFKDRAENEEIQLQAKLALEKIKERLEEEKKRRPQNAYQPKKRQLATMSRLRRRQRNAGRSGSRRIQRRRA